MTDEANQKKYAYTQVQQIKFWSDRATIEGGFVKGDAVYIGISHPASSSETHLWVCVQPEKHWHRSRSWLGWVWRGNVIETCDRPDANNDGSTGQEER